MGDDKKKPLLFNNRTLKKVLILAVSWFFASLASRLTLTLFKVVSGFPSMQKRILLHEILSIAGLFFAIVAFLLVLIASYKAFKKYIESGKIT